MRVSFIFAVGVVLLVTVQEAACFVARSVPRRSVRGRAVMLDQTTTIIATTLLGTAAGVGLIAFTEKQGTRAEERGAKLSDTMVDRLSSKLLEDYEANESDQISALTEKMQAALKEEGVEVKEAEEVKVEDDGW